MVDVTVKEAAEILDFDPRWVRTLLKTEKIPGGHHNGRKWLIPEEGIQRYQSGQTKVAVRGPKEKLRYLGGDTLGNLTALVSDQIRETIPRHWEDLRGEAATWRDLIGIRHDYDITFTFFETGDYPQILEYGIPVYQSFNNYLGPDEDRTLLPNCLLAHLEKDLPDAYRKFKLWKERTLNLLRNISLFQDKWINVVLQKLSEKHSNFVETATSFQPLDLKAFAWSHWNAMIDLYIVSTFWTGSPKMADCEVERVFHQDRYYFKRLDLEDHKYGLYYSDYEIAVGSKEWLTYLKEFHQNFGHDLFVKEVLNCLGSWDPSSQIKVLADDAYEQLDMVCLGGIVFKPGHCRICRALVI